MAKFAHPSKLDREEQEKILTKLCRAITKIKSPIEAARFLKDLLSHQEAEMLAKRLKIAELLLAGETYAEICSHLKVSHTTVARVYEWVKLSGDGYRLVLERTKDNKDSRKSDEINYDSWRSIKKRYPTYYWPQLLLEGVIKAAKKRDKQKIQEAFRQMDKKSALYKRLNKLFGAGYGKKYANYF